MNPEMCEVGKELAGSVNYILYYMTSEGKCDTQLGQHIRECSICRETLPINLQVEYSPNATN